MTNFFTTSSGESIEQTDSFENSGSQPVIPEGTQLHADVIESSWEPETNFNKEHILVRWFITEKGKYNGFIVKHKLQVFDDTVLKSGETKGDKAKKMLMAIDTNHKGELNKLVNTNKFEQGDNLQLSRALNGASAIITLAVYDIASTTGGDNVTGNWVRGVSPVSKEQKQEDKHIEQQAQRQPSSNATPNNDEFDENIPF